MADRPSESSVPEAVSPHAGTFPNSVLVLVSLAALGLGLWHARHFYHDDAFIALRYAERLLTGHGLTWTDGERVEGYSSPLWVGLSAGLGALGIPLEAASRILGVASLLLLAWLVLHVAGPIALLIVASHFGLLIWSLGGLESTGFAFLLTLGAWLIWRAGSHDPRWPQSVARASIPAAWFAGIAFALAGLTRPEGFVAGAVAMLLIPPPWRANAWRVALPCAAAGLGWLAFRGTYYGDMLPNVAYAKGSGIALGLRLAGALQYLSSNWLYWVPPAACAFAAIALARSWRYARVLWLTLPVLAGIVFAGGDHMPYGRLLAPIVPLCACAIGWAALAVPARARPIAALALLAAAIPFAVQLMAPIERDYAATVGAPVGRYLEQNLRAGSLVAVGTAGSTPFHAPSLRFIDTMGLNDRVIAHAPVGPVVTRLQQYSGHVKGDGAYVLSRRPDLIVLGPAEGYLGDPPTAWSLTDYQLIESAEFRSNYAPFGFRAPVDSAEADHPRIRELLDAERRTLRFIAYLRLDSEPARDLAYRGVLLRAPWE